ncbi:tetraprenyl-beta-curcumene synthase family protein [Shouchella lonarensis]|uniref:Tetraprenyl-beta-curcumene synthase n=1 Tax=Shouchella lonarensis TaxID=1464122 RepID=A0A1G6K639_9BACI|nr:tetraprenyl-beta-curcumene synthase family protein [Shouchella lonarensis]SDC26424.1 tetraprenyl-beta-curcumene synthase [Shouchella lonarensis]
MSAPTTAIPLLYRIYRKVIPTVHKHYDAWINRAQTIPDPELRSQALDALARKKFHCEGGGVYGLAAQGHFEELIQFIISYQLICDYLDNLCDQSDSLDPNDFRALHNALLIALQPGVAHEDYYAYRAQKDDGGYLQALVENCQKIVTTFPSFTVFQPHMLKMSGLYGDLQVYKHVKKEDREPLLKAFFEKHRHDLPEEMTWYEFAACTASTLAIYTMATYATKPDVSWELAQTICDGYYPYVQGMHILLDYFIDQKEDIADDELNFLFYYDSKEQMEERFRYFVRKAEETLSELPDPKFHRMLIRGVIALYLADEKVQKDPELKGQSKEIFKTGGLHTFFFFLMNSRIFRRK